MSAETARQVPLPQVAEGKTEAGNYFVANYPPFSFWKPENVGEAFAVLDRAPAAGVPLGVYAHIPFCRKRCHFCYFKVYTDKNADEIGRYVRAVLAEMEMYAGKRFIGGRKVDFVYFGGGTPSYLSPEQLAVLFDGMKKLLPWDATREVTFEGEPGTLNERKMEFLRGAGVTRLSLGVENFKEEILRVNGRAHGAKEIDRAYDFARKVGFPQINIDLIAGMVNETEENWADCVRKTIERQPDSVTIYQMEVPYNTTLYQEMKASGQVTAPVADWATKRRWVDQAFTELEKAGYTVSSAYTAVRDAGKTRFVYRDSLWAGADMIGLGVASFSHVGGTHFQNQHQIEEYEAEVEAGRLPIYRALTMSGEERLVRELVLQMKLGRVSRGYFAKKYGVDLAERFAEPLKEYERAGLVRVGGEYVTFSRVALLQVDRLLHGFFLPHHRHARYA